MAVYQHAITVVTFPKSYNIALCEQRKHQINKHHSLVRSPRAKLFLWGNTITTHQEISNMIKEIKDILSRMTWAEIIQSIVGSICVFGTIYVLLLIAYGLEGINYVH